MTKQTNRRANPLGRVRLRKAWLTSPRTATTRSGFRMTESRLDAYAYNGRNELTNAVKNGVAAHYEYAPFGAVTARTRDPAIQ